MRREDYDCEGLADFAERFGEDLANEMVQEVLEAHYACQGILGRYGRVRILAHDSLDREGANHRFEGEITHGARRWWYVIDDGNWNGTMIREWERINKYPAAPVPARGVWFMQPAAVIATRFIIDGDRDLLIDRLPHIRSIPC